VEAALTAFERYADAMLAFFALGTTVPIAFGAVVLIGGSPVTPDQYGEVVYAIPALVWAGAQLAIMGAAALGAAFRWPLVTAFAAAGVFVYFSFLAAAAALAGPTGTLVVAGCGLWLAPVAAICSVVAWRGRNGRG